MRPRKYLFEVLKNIFIAKGLHFQSRFIRLNHATTGYASLG